MGSHSLKTRFRVKRDSNQEATLKDRCSSRTSRPTGGRQKFRGVGRTDSADSGQSAAGEELDESRGGRIEERH